MAEKTALILLVSEGAEEMEVVITGDVLVRGGVKVTYAGLSGPDAINCARGLKILPDVALEKVKDNKFDLVVLPGGPGSSKLGECPVVGKILKNQQEEGRLIAAICAAPTSLMAHGIKVDLLTSHPSVKDKLKKGGYNYSEDRVVVSGKVITSRGPGTSFEFGLKLVELLNGAEKAKSLVGPLVLQE